MRRHSVGSTFACALRSNGRVSCWGAGASGQLGNGQHLDSNIPVEVSELGMPQESAVVECMRVRFFRTDKYIAGD